MMISKRLITSTLTQQITGLRLELRWSYSGLFPAFLRQVLRPGEQVVQESQAGVVHVLRDLDQQVFQVFVDLKPIRRKRKSHPRFECIPAMCYNLHIKMNNILLYGDEMHCYLQTVPSRRKDLQFLKTMVQ